MADQSLGKRIQFGIWSDGPVPAEELELRLKEHGQQAMILTADRDTLVDCFVVLTRNRPTAAQRAVLTRLANRATVTIAAERSGPAPEEPGGWPRDVTLEWNGQISELTTLAADLMNLVRPTGPVFSRLPKLQPIDEPLPGTDVAASREVLVETLSGEVRPRVVPVARALWNELRENRKAVSRTDYSLRRLAGWAAEPGSRAFVNVRLSRREDLTSSLTRPVSLTHVMGDPQTRPLVMLLGEPSAGKSLQLRYYDAFAALRHLELRSDAEQVPPTFYVALADQPARPNISLDWLRQRWGATVDVGRWCDFGVFLEDGGTVLLDGLNEGGVRGLEPEQWMSQWRDVIQELFERGAGKVVVSCRTRDQAVQMNVPRDREPTKVTILPLSREEIIAIATEREVGMARRLDRAFTRDPGLIELYSSPVRLQSYLGSGAPWVATTSTRLFGVELSAAIVREWSHDVPQRKPIPGRQASTLETIAQSNRDPWPVLETIPLIRGLGQLAKELSLPASPNGKARLAMSPGDAGEFLARAIRQVDDRPVTPQEALETAKDLHVLWLDQDKIRFTHPSVQHLFAAIGCTLEELAGLAEQERERALQDGADPAPAAPPSYAHHRYDELFQFAAQRRGVEVPDRLLAVDPVLAARVFIAIGRDVPDDAIRDRIVASLRAQLDKIFVPPVRAGILAALGDLGWSLPAAGEGGRGATMLVPGRRWTLGRPADPATDERNVHSEARDIELAPFRIARFPVSNAEYATFVEDGGYEDQSLWAAGGLGMAYPPARPAEIRGRLATPAGPPATGSSGADHPAPARGEGNSRRGGRPRPFRQDDRR